MIKSRLRTVITLLPLLCLPAWCVGSVQQSAERLGTTNNVALTYSWTGDAVNGSVPVTPAQLGLFGPGVNIQGYRVLTVQTAPGAPAPTNGYSVQLRDALGGDIMSGAMASLSSTAVQFFSANSTTPPIFGTFSLAITGQSVAGATGRVVVYLGPTTIVTATAGAAGPAGPAGATGPTGPPGGGLNASDYNFTPQTPGGTLTGTIAANVTLTPCPGGVNGTNTAHYLYITGGVGTPEAVLITGGTCTSGAATGTVIFTPANNHSGAWTIGPASCGVQEAIWAAGSPRRIQAAIGSCTLLGPVTVLGGGYSLIGAGFHATIFNVASNFPLTAAGVFVLAPATVGLNATISFATLRDFQVTFIQPDSTVIGSYTQWPPAFYAQGSTYARFENLRTDLAWVSYDFRANGTGPTLTNCWISGFGTGVFTAGNGDFVTLINAQFTAGPSATVNNATAYGANATGINNNGSFLEVIGGLSLASTSLIQSGGTSYSTFVGFGFDTQNGFTNAGGNLRITGSYFTPSGSAFAGSMTGGTTMISNSIITAPASATALFTVATNANTEFMATGNRFTLLGDRTAISVTIQAFGEIDANYFSVPSAVLTRPIISITSTSANFDITGNTLFPFSGTGTFLSIPNQVVSGQLVVQGNNYNGLGLTLNANPSNIAIDTGLPTYGAPVASAGTIAPTGEQFHITGTAAIATISLPLGFVVGTVCAIPDAAFTTTTAGNIALASTAVISKVLCWTYDPVSVKWFPFY